ncbi:o-succinylbenzoate synthase [Limibacter armeniacum]|uniref:o-succinylbenzoate synthase n=1 Tax=Limibacter armeniacum TaxID=466084 RepID=UPI002FE62F34
MINIEYKKHILRFNFPAKTSRGAMDVKPTYFIKLTDTENPEWFGVGECSMLPGLSIDDDVNYEIYLASFCQSLMHLQDIKSIDELHDISNFPSIKFGLEMAVRDFQRNKNKKLFSNGFAEGEIRIPINGLVWMGNKNFMLEQVKTKIEKGFDCIKIKVGAINFDEELEVIKSIRDTFSSDEITIRLDANGAFKPGSDAQEKLLRLSEFEIHSIEQPIMAKQWEEMAALCAQTPIPIALDEELIGVMPDHRNQLLDMIKPQHIILKPSLIGGFTDAKDWIEKAESKDIGWWVTSALESNIGLNAICQFTANYDIKMPQGLGTGQLYHNNIDSPLTIENGEIYYDNNKDWGKVF